MNTLKHIPVLLDEVIALAEIKPGMCVVDATLGGGSYTRRLLDLVGSSGRVFAFDWDQSAIEHFQEETSLDVQQALEEGRLILVHQSYATLSSVLHQQGLEHVDVIVADLGFSSLQLDDPERGLSFQQDGPLDMRLNSTETVTAADIVNQWDENSLAELFRVYADEGEAERIARAIVSRRRQALLTRTSELAELVRAHVVPARRRGKIHPATKVFQALRMAVNSEREHLQLFLRQGVEALVSGGRFLVVTFHSGEDLLVKQAFRVVVGHAEGKLINKKPIVPTSAECIQNPRARSAKLRGLQKC